mmetsp:Transcript_26724/g.41820  ORF Transcript_26724/g.41820 Transcript_26724/m.41820 type:complete len:81 (-) Transcript_26724:1221-1463(-)
MLVDDDFHTLDYAIETIERVLLEAGVVGRSGKVRKERVHWIALQAHHYGKGLVSVLPSGLAQQALLGLLDAGMSARLVAD